jgi:hypothetical protein
MQASWPGGRLDARAPGYHRQYDQYTAGNETSPRLALLARLRRARPPTDRRNNLIHVKSWY